MQLYLRERCMAYYFLQHMEVDWHLNNNIKMLFKYK